MNFNQTDLPGHPTRNPIALLILLVLLLAPLAARSAPVMLDRIVAVVNNAVITQSQLDQRTEQTLHQMALSKTTPPPRKVLEKRILQSMITENVLLQIAEKDNIHVSGDDLDQAVTSIAERNHLDLPAFRKALEKSGVDFKSYRQEIRRQMTIARLRADEVDRHIVVTNAEIDNFLANQKHDPNRKTEYHLARILLLAPEGASPEDLKKLKAKAEKARAELQNGADFALVSATYSDAQNALQGGDMGWRSETKLPTLFVNAVKNLKIGDITPILHSPNGYHILKLLGKRGADTKVIVHQIHARDILIKTNELVSDKDARIQLAQLRDRLINGSADFANLAKHFSNGPAASKGGDLGWLSPGDAPPEIERILNATPVNSISEPIKTRYGWQIFQVLGRRDEDISQQRQRLLARQSILERKSDEAFEEWVREARDSAYVKNMLDEDDQ